MSSSPIFEISRHEFLEPMRSSIMAQRSIEALSRHSPTCLEVIVDAMTRFAKHVWALGPSFFLSLEAKARLQTMALGALGNLAANNPNNQADQLMRGLLAMPGSYCRG